jgi:CDP-glucose 4,6-dehydratase
MDLYGHTKGHGGYTEPVEKRTSQMEGGLMFNNIYKGKRVLVTGCCGFKGGWLSCWLNKLGADVYGFGHNPRTKPNHFDLYCHDKIRRSVKIGDLLDYDYLKEFISVIQPDIIFHLAAKAIVARTFHEPRETFENNIMGTVNLLEACRQTNPNIKLVLITTDKVYNNEEWNWGYREVDKLGGLDPYSASKVCIEHVIECYRTQFLPYIATARAGNVIGGGDWSEKRLIPDIVKATADGREVEIHTPYATRPWQHVLEPLCGYLMLGQKLLGEKCVDDEDRNFSTKSFAKPWNFGPEGEMTVLDILKIAQEVWPKIKYVVKEEETHPSMVQLLKIDSTEARKRLGWGPRWHMKYAVTKTIQWYKEYYENGKIMTNDDIEEYERELE